MVQSVDNFKTKCTLIQIGASLLINWGMINSGIALGFPSVAVPPLLGSGPGLHASVSEASWVAGLSFASAPVAALMAGPLIDSIGRRWSLQLLNVTFAAGWLLIAVFPLSLLALYAGRLLTGFGMGLVASTAASYTAEIASVSLRTVLVNFIPIMMAAGVFLSYLGAFLYQESWSEVSWFGFGISVMSLVLTPLLPESPLWLLSRGRAEEALQALQRLRAATAPEQVKEELDSFSSRASDKQQTTSWLSTFHNLRQPQAYKPLLFINAFFIFVQGSGVLILISYAVNFSQIAQLDVQAYQVSLAIAVMRVVATLLTSWVCNRYGKRGPALFFGSVTAVSIGVLAATVYPFFTLPYWMITTVVLVYVLSCCVCFSSIPWSMLGEIFPTNVRGIANGLTTSIAFIESVFMVKLYPEAVLSFGAFPVFSFFSVCSLLGTVFLYYFLPETHGKTLKEIEEYFTGDL
ncbi:hypothetical protein J6590_097358 [Homalodisca vitripennis]|nr:hypothetical protein J6590_097358 [Homalodisca vitripennis]